jgi:hypothetical protein
MRDISMVHTTYRRETPAEADEREERRTIVHLLLKSGARVTVRDANGISVLESAAMSGDANLIHAVVRAGASVDERDLKTGMPPVCYALLSMEGFVAFMEEGANVNASCGAEGTPLDIAERRYQDTFLAGFDPREVQSTRIAYASVRDAVIRLGGKTSAELQAARPVTTPPNPTTTANVQPPTPTPTPAPAPSSTVAKSSYVTGRYFCVDDRDGSSRGTCDLTTTAASCGEAIANHRRQVASSGDVCRNCLGTLDNTRHLSRMEWIHAGPCQGMP